MTVPNIPFKGSQAHVEFGIGPPGKGTPLFAAAGLPLPAKGSQLAGKSASTHQYTIGISSNGIWCGYCDGGPSAWTDMVFGGLTPWDISPELGIGCTDLGCVTDTAGYQHTFLSLSNSVSDEIFDITFPDKSTYTFVFIQTHTGTCSDDAGFAAKVRAYLGQTIGITITRR